MSAGTTAASLGTTRALWTATTHAPLGVSFNRNASTEIPWDLANPCPAGDGRPCASYAADFGGPIVSHCTVGCTPRTSNASRLGVAHTSIVSQTNPFDEDKWPLAPNARRNRARDR